MTIAIASFSSYPSSPFAVGGHTTRRPVGLEHVTRHPFFVGIGLLGAAHALLASRLAGTAFFGILAVYSLVGAAHQDRKLLAQRGRPYADYLAATSFLPFGAIVAGRRLPWSELPWLGLAIAGATAGLLLAVHDSIFAHGGAWVIGATVGGAAVMSLLAWRTATRRASRLSERRPPTSFDGELDREGVRR